MSEKNVTEAPPVQFTEHLKIEDFHYLRKKRNETMAVTIEESNVEKSIKKTAEALNGSIAGFGEVIIVTPSFATIPKEVERPKEEKKKSEWDEF